MRLRVDPWDPEYGASVELMTDLAPPVGLDLDIEVAGDWLPIAAPRLPGKPCCAFIDGVRRIDAWLIAEEGDAQAPGLAGSWAVGCAWSRQPPVIADVEVGRELIVGGGLTSPALEVRVGEQPLSFRASSRAGSEPLEPLRGLQNAMRDAEAALGQAVLAGGAADLVVVDGPLGYTAPGALVGMVKRQSRSYLDQARAAVIARLAPGERTPMFKLGQQRLERYSWYLRLVSGRRIDGALAGVVRLEVDAAQGIGAAQALADVAGAVLPMFASTPERDPRAPQNLYPVGALETRLRHRLGDAELIHRAIEATLLKELQRA